jgi:hypothetical protein
VGLNQPMDGLVFSPSLEGSFDRSYSNRVPVAGELHVSLVGRRNLSAETIVNRTRRTHGRTIGLYGDHARRRYRLGR